MNDKPRPIGQDHAPIGEQQAIRTAQALASEEPEIQGAMEEAKSVVGDFLIVRSREIRNSIPGTHTLYHAVADIADERDALQGELSILKDQYRTVRESGKKMTDAHNRRAQENAALRAECERMRDGRDRARRELEEEKRLASVAYASLYEQHREVVRKNAALAEELKQAQDTAHWRIDANGSLASKIRELESKNAALAEKLKRAQDTAIGIWRKRGTDPVWAEVETEVNRARSLYPDWPLNIVHAAAIAAEEMGEIVKDCNTFHWRQGKATVQDVRKEAIQTIAMLYRFLTETPILAAPASFEGDSSE